MTTMKRFLSLALVLALSLTAFGCGLAKKPPGSGEQPVPPKPGPGAPADTLTAAIYFADWQAQHLIPEPRQIAKAEDPRVQATKVVEELLAGPKDPHLHRTLPAGVKLLNGVTIENGTAYVNLSKELQSVRGSAAVTMAFGSIALSLTEIPGISKVQVLVEGKKDVEIDQSVSIEPMTRPFFGDLAMFVDIERAKYLNDRVAKGLDTWRTDPVQLVQWEGRMFGFTADELKNAEFTKRSETTYAARLVRDGKRYDMQVSRYQNGIWLIEHIASAPVPKPVTGVTQTIAVYFGDFQAQHVVPEARAVEASEGTEALVNRAVEALLAGPNDPHLFRTIPGSVRLLEPVRFLNGTVTVNLSEELLSVHGSTGTGGVIKSLVYSLTDIPGVQQVRLLIGGKSSGDWSQSGRETYERHLSTYNVFPDPERAKYLQRQVANGVETWRTDVHRVVAWEGRMFGFTAAEMAKAPVQVNGSKAAATVKRGQESYTIGLEQLQSGGVWTVVSIAESK